MQKTAQSRGSDALYRERRKKSTVQGHAKGFSSPLAVPVLKCDGIWIQQHTRCEREEEAGFIGIFRKGVFWWML